MTRDYKKWTAKPCFLPGIADATAQLGGNSTLHLNLDYTTNVPIEGCARPQCNGTKKFKVKLVLFDSLKSMKRGKYKYGGDRHSDWVKFENGQTSVAIAHQDISQDKYYKMVIKSVVSKSNKMYNAHGNWKRWKKEKKMKCFFGMQGI